MPSKEEIEEAKRNCKKILEYTNPLSGMADFDYCDVDTLISGLEQLEAEKTEVISYIQRMIVMTREAIKNLTDTKYYYERQEMKAKLEVYKEILDLMKGEKK